MAQDIASLGLTIDSTQAQTASSNLDKFRGSADSAATATRGLERQALDTQHGLGGLSDQTQQLTKTLDQTVASFATLMAQMQAAKGAFDGSTQSLKSWDAAAQKVDALGRAFGTTARGLDAYNQAAGQLGFTTEQQAQSLQRMTLAIENQTSAGAQLRRVMSEYGISVRDLGLDQADVLLRRVADGFSKVADNAKRTRDAQALLGTLDPDSLGKVLSPNYVPIQQRHEDQRASASNAENDRVDTNIRQRARTEDLTQQHYQDLQTRYRGLDTASNSRLKGGISEEDEKSLRHLAPEGSAFLRDGRSTREGRIALGDQLAATDMTPDPNFEKPPEYHQAQDLAKRNARRPDLTARNGMLGDTLLGRLYYNTEDGNLARNNRQIAEDTIEESNNATGIGGRALAMIRGQGKEVAGLFGAMQKPPPVVRPNALNSVGDAATLAGFGDTSLQRFQQSRDTLKLFGRQASDGGPVTDNTGDRAPAPGTGTADAAGAEALGAFASYGNDAAQELRFRRSQVQAQQRNAFRPGGAAVDQADLEASLASMSLGDQGKARAFAAFAGQRGGDTRLLEGQSLSDMLDPAKSGGGNMSPQLVRDFNESDAANSKASDRQFNQQSSLRQLNTYQQAGSASVGPTGAEDLATYQQAYNKALQETSREAEAVRRAEEALKQVQADRFLQASKAIAEQDRQNTLDQQRIGSSGGSASSSLSDIASSRYQATIDMQVKDETARLKLTPDQQSARSAGLAGKLGNQAIEGAQNTSLAAKQELQDAQAASSFQTQSVATQAQMNRELEVEKSYREAIAQARVADAKDNGGRLETIQAEIERTKALKNAIAELNAEAKAFSLGRDASQGAMDERSIRALPRDQQARARALQPAMRFARDNGLNGAPVNPDTSLESGFAQSSYGATPNGPAARALGGAAAGSSIDSFAQRMGLSESSGNAGIVNSRGYAGTYQFGSERLSDPALGMYHPVSGENLKANQWRGTFDVPGFPEVKTLPDFLASPGAQHAAFGAHIADIDQHIDQTPGASAYDRDGLRAEAHLGGSGGMAKWVASGGTANPDDGRTSLTDYYNKFRAGGPSGAGNLPAGAGNMSPGTNRYAQGLGDQHDATIEGQRQDLQAGSDVQYQGGQAAMRATREGRTADATIARQGSYDTIDPNAALRSSLAIRQTQQGLQTEFAASQASTDQSIESNSRLSAAYAAGGKAIGELTDKMKVEQEAREKNLSLSQQEERYAQLQKDRSIQQGAAIEQNMRGSRDSNQLQETDNSMLFASQEARDRAQAKVKTQQDLDNTYSNAPQSERDAFVKQQDVNQNLKETTARVQELRSGFSSMGSTGMEGVNSLITGTGKLKDVAASVTMAWAQMLLKMAEKPLMDAGGDWLSSLLQLGSKATGMASGVPGAGSDPFSGAGVGSDPFGGAGGSGFSSFSAGAPMVNAAGNAFVGGVRMFASGGVLDRPTRFFSAGGEANVAGEAGNEALLPLRRMPNGDMGVATGGGGGGGGGHTITVHAPITVNGGGGSSSNGKMDPAAVASMQKQLSETVRQSVVSVIADEKRPGGSLY